MIIMVIVIITMGQTCFSALLRNLSAAFESFSSSLTSATYIKVMVMVMVMDIQEEGEAHLLDKHLPLLLPPSPLSLPQASQ